MASRSANARGVYRILISSYAATSIGFGDCLVGNELATVGLGDPFLDVHPFSTVENIDAAASLLDFFGKRGKFLLIGLRPVLGAFEQVLEPRRHGDIITHEGFFATVGAISRKLGNSAIRCASESAPLQKNPRRSLPRQRHSSCSATAARPQARPIHRPRPRSGVKKARATPIGAPIAQ